EVLTAIEVLDKQLSEMYGVEELDVYKEYVELKEQVLEELEKEDADYEKLRDSLISKYSEVSKEYEKENEGLEVDISNELEKLQDKVLNTGVEKEHSLEASFETMPENATNGVKESKSVFDKAHEEFKQANNNLDALGKEIESYKGKELTEEEISNLNTKKAEYSKLKEEAQSKKNAM